MKDRFTLAFLILMLWVFLIIFQNLIPSASKVYIIVGFVFAYTLYMNAAYKHHKRKAKKNPPSLDFDYQPMVSILIPAHNEGSVIAKTIENILQIEYKNFEVIVIDDRSSDNTAEVIKQQAAKYPEKVRSIIRDESAFPGKSAVLNEATEVAKGDIICVFDADARVNPDFLTANLPYMSIKDVGAVQTRKIIMNKDYNFLTRSQNNEYTLDTHFQLSRDSIKGAVELRGNGQLVKRQALNDVGGWNIHSITDDLDLSTKLHLKGWDVRLCTVSPVYEEGIIKFMPLLRQRRRWVEGSIRRYLDYFMEVLFSKKISFRASFDMWAYIFEFVMPVWLFSEWIIQSFKFIRGHENHVLSSMAMMICVGIFFVCGLLYSLRKYDKLSWFQTVKQSIETAFYLMTVWTPIVTVIVLKILFTKRTMDWGKTQHGVDETQETVPA